MPEAEPPASTLFTRRAVGIPSVGVGLGVLVTVAVAVVVGVLVGVLVGVSVGVMYAPRKRCQFTAPLTRLALGTSATADNSTVKAIMRRI
jgi:hypothetical protein